MLNAGIVGLPNVGKSTIFSAITSMQVDAQNYPFCTIEPNSGIVNVPDSRLEMISQYVKAQKIIPAVCGFVDIAGLVKGASKGEGLGNKFLSHIRETSLIIHVVRCFDHKDIIHVEGSVDPVRDINIINSELLLSDVELIQKKLPKLEKDFRSQNKEIATSAKETAVVFKKIEKQLFEDIPIRNMEFSKEEKFIVDREQFITAKPMLYVCNVDEDNILQDNDYVKKLKEYVAKENTKVIKICGQIEKEIADMQTAQEKKEYLDLMGLTESGLDNLIRNAYSYLGLRTYFTAGEKEIRAWTFNAGAKAPECAGIIHTDFQKGFIKADVYSCELLQEYKSINAIKDAGKIRLEGKEYVVQDGDVMLFKFNL